MTDDRPRLELLYREMAVRHGVDAARVRVVRSPYRICPLGAHIDHQLGPVTAMAIDRSVLLAFAHTDDRSVRLSSLDFPGRVEFRLDDVPGKQADDWGNYPRGAVSALQRRHAMHRGIVGITSGRLHGGGVSSSAAVGVAFLLAFEHANGLDVSPAENITLGLEIENRYIGLRIGILDQAAILLSHRGSLTSIDCATARHELIPAPAGLAPFTILLAFSGLTRPLVATDYNRRVDECAEAARVLLKAARREGVAPVLGNVTAQEYAGHKHLLRDAPARRAAHVFSEIERVGQGIDAWRRGDLDRFGALMTASGESSIGSYECGSPPLIDLHRFLADTDGVLGTRFSGAGFRGCCVALVRPELAGQVADEVRGRYAKAHPGLAAGAAIELCDTADGAAVLDDDRSQRGQVANRAGRDDN